MYKHLKPSNASLAAACLLMAMSFTSSTQAIASSPESNRAVSKANIQSKTKLEANKAVEQPVKIVDNIIVATASDLQALRITRIYDKDAGVLCYQVKYQAGMTCVPLSQTKLREENMSKVRE